MTSFSLAPIGMLLLVACLIAMLTRRFGWPYSVGLAAAGAGIAYLPDAPQLPLSRDLIFNIFLPPLIFEAALQLDWKPFRRELPVTLVLAVAGVAIAASVVAAGMHWLVGWSWLGAAFFAVLIAATDPVSVIASFRELKVEPRLSMLVESESLLNDGVVAVLFAVLLAIVVGGSSSTASVLGDFLWTMGGGVVIGLLSGGAVLLIAGRTEDHLVEITLTTVAAYGSFLAAEDLHASGVLASLTAGLVIGNVGRLGAISHKGHGHLRDAWDYFAFLANSFVFILIGMNVARMPVGLPWLTTGAIAVVLVLVGRAAGVYSLSTAFRRSRLAVPTRYQHVLFWGGLRGALALALALALPKIPERGAIILMTFLVVAFSLFVQGLTMPTLVRRLKIVCGKDSEEERCREADA
ncbi:MAG TPA: sodium:proton antiporter [Sphingomicrobium sp.]|nr:sodium:proton antiporter [Sphingomicrobium sp.]